MMFLKRMLCIFKKNTETNQPACETACEVEERARINQDADLYEKAFWLYSKEFNQGGPEIEYCGTMAFYKVASDAHTQAYVKNVTRCMQEIRKINQNHRVFDRPD